MNEQNQKICKRCLLREMAQADREMIEKYKSAIKNDDRVNNTLYEERITICKGCEKLNAGTCAACGCYVELRALSKISTCPYKKW